VQLPAARNNNEGGGRGGGGGGGDDGSSGSLAAAQALAHVHVDEGDYEHQRRVKSGTSSNRRIIYDSSWSIDLSQMNRIFGDRLYD
jgi:hypothetical protein